MQNSIQQIIQIPTFHMQMTHKKLTLETSENLTTEQKEFVEDVFTTIPHIKEESVFEFLKRKAGTRNQPIPSLAMFPAKGRVIFYDSKNGQIVNVDTPVAVIKL
jgi:DNA replication initiation complex subunit (GINS family)